LHPGVAPAYFAEAPPTEPLATHRKSHMLKAIFGIVGLLLALIIVGSLAKHQLRSLGQIGQTTPRVHGPAAQEASKTGGAAGSVAGRAVGGARLDGFAATAGAEMPTAQQQIQGIQQSVRERTNNALEQGAQRNQRAQP
jgi:hypothetical protein